MRRHLTAALRALVDHAVTADLPEEEAERLAEKMHEMDAHLRSFPRRPRKVANLPDMNDLQYAFWGDPIIGEHNPIAPPVKVVIEDGTVRGSVRLGHPYEGPPGYVHGAVVAGIFDILLGLANIASGNPGMTGTLTIRYLQPTPLHADLTFDAMTKRVDGRKIHTTGTCRADDTLCAEAEGVFVRIGSGRSAEIFRER
jgi:acyl-coenzyme A thioesterase PaaI-like protein